MKQWLVCLFPSAWRQRYEAEFSALLEQQRLSSWLVLDIICGILDAYWLQWQWKERGGQMSAPVHSSELRSILVLFTGVLLVLRSVAHSSLLVLGIDFLGVAGVICLLLGLRLTYYVRRQKGEPV